MTSHRQYVKLIWCFIKGSRLHYYMYIMPWHIVFSEDLYLCPFPSVSRLQQIYQTDCSHSLVSARTHSISRYIRSSGYIYIQTFYIHKRNVLRFLRHGTQHVVVRGGSHFCQSLRVGGQEFFSLKRKGGPKLFLEDNIKIPQPPQEKTYFSQRCVAQQQAFSRP